LARWQLLSRCGLAAAVVTMAPGASAEGSVPVRLDYLAPDACPNRESVLDALRARAPRLRLANASEPARMLALRVDASTSSFRGELTISAVDGSSTHRDLAAPTCDAVVAGLALVAALSIDGATVAAAATLPVAPAPAEAESSGLAPAIASTPPAAPQEAAASLAPVVPPTRSPPPASQAPRPSAEPGHRRLRLGVGVDAEVLGLSAPGAVFAPGVFAELLVESSSVLSPSLRLGFVRAEGGDDGGTPAAPGRTATYTWLFGRLEACPIRAHVLRTVALVPCLGVDVGEISSTTNALQPFNPSRLWADATVEARIEWRVLTRVSLELQGGPMVPMTRDTFTFAAPAGTAYRAPAVTGLGSIGLLVLFL
jgi:hypothetical protein